MENSFSFISQNIKQNQINFSTTFCLTEPISFASYMAEYESSTCRFYNKGASLQYKRIRQESCKMDQTFLSNVEL